MKHRQKRGKQFQLVEWSDQVRPVTSVRQGAVRRRFYSKSGSSLSSGRKRNLLGMFQVIPSTDGPSTSYLKTCIYSLPCIFTIKGTWAIFAAAIDPFSSYLLQSCESRNGVHTRCSNMFAGSLVASFVPIPIFSEQFGVSK